MTRLERAEKHNTRGAIQLQAYKEKDVADIWFDAKNKDVPEWRRPGEILSVDASDGNFLVWVQGRTSLRWPQEVRPHVLLHTFTVDAGTAGVQYGLCGTLGRGLLLRWAWFGTRGAQDGY